MVNSSNTFYFTRKMRAIEMIKGGVNFQYNSLKYSTTRFGTSIAEIKVNSDNYWIALRDCVNEIKPEQLAWYMVIPLGGFVIRASKVLESDPPNQSTSQYLKGSNPYAVSDAGRALYRQRSLVVRGWCACLALVDTEHR